MTVDATRLVVRYETTSPLELTSLTTSLAALADEYRRFTDGGESVLIVEEITEGSVKAVLKGVAKAAIASVDPLFPMTPYALDIVAPFAGQWSGLLNALANYGRAGADTDLSLVDKRSLKAAKAFVQPAVNGNAIQVYGENNKIVQNNFYVDTRVGADVNRVVDHLLAHIPADDLRFENEPLALYQLRDARKGDLGFIDRFDKKPKRLSFADDGVKSAILHGEASPFDVFFFVSGIARTARGEIASYHIERIDGVTEKDAG